MAEVGVEDGGNGETRIDGFDDLLNNLGNGRWTLFLYSLAGLCHFYTATQVLNGAFNAPVMRYTCRHPNLTTLTSFTSPSTLDLTNLTTHIITPIDECRYNVTSGDGKVWQEECTEWDFDHSTFGNTLTSEMSLVCGRSYLVPLYQSVYMFGSIFGASLGGLLSDKVGRRPVFVWSMVLHLLVTSVTCFFQNISLILVARFIVGIFHLSSIQPSYIMMMENIRSSARALMGMLVALPWAVGIMVFGGMGYAIRDWRHLQLAVCLPFVLMLFMTWYLNESPRWLLVRGELQQAQMVLNRVAKWNRVDPPPPGTLELIMANLQAQQKKDETESSSSGTAWSALRQRALSVLVLIRLDFGVSTMDNYTRIYYG